MRHNYLSALITVLFLWLSTPALAGVIEFSNLSYNLIGGTGIFNGNLPASSDRSEQDGTVNLPESFSLLAESPEGASRLNVSFDFFDNGQFAFEGDYETSTSESSIASSIAVLDFLILVDFTIESAVDELVELSYSSFSEVLRDSGLEAAQGGRSSAVQLLANSWEQGAGNPLRINQLPIQGSASFSENFLLETNRTYGLVLQFALRVADEDGISSTNSGSFRGGHGVAIASVPEPSGLILLGLAILGVRLRVASLVGK